MSGYIFILHKKYSDASHKYNYDNTCLISSTTNYITRIYRYISLEPFFNNITHDLYVFKINNLKYSCFVLNKIIRYNSEKYNVPYPKINSDGGGEHYEYNNDPEKICEFFDLIGVEYEYHKCDIDELKKSVSGELNKELEIKGIEQQLEDYKKLIDTHLTDNIINEINNFIKNKIQIVKDKK